jgi:transposase
MRVRIARDELRRLRELTLAINRLEREITELVSQLAPQLLAEPGFGPLIAAKLVGEIAGAQRFATAAKLARRRSEGKSTREAIRCLKRYLAHASGDCCSRPTPLRTSHHQFLDIEATEPGVRCCVVPADGR